MSKTKRAEWFPILNVIYQIDNNPKYFFNADTETQREVADQIVRAFSFAVYDYSAHLKNIKDLVPNLSLEQEQWADIARVLVGFLQKIYSSATANPHADLTKDTYRFLINRELQDNGCNQFFAPFSILNSDDQSTE